jgi:hypothetical protein
VDCNLGVETKLACFFYPDRNINGGASGSQRPDYGSPSETKSCCTGRTSSFDFKFLFMKEQLVLLNTNVNITDFWNVALCRVVDIY